MSDMIAGRPYDDSKYPNPMIMRLFLWSGVVVVVTLIFAQGYLMGFVPGLSPALSPAAVAQYFIDHRLSILLGALIQCICWTLWITWSTAIIMLQYRMERGAPLLTFTSVVINGGGYVFFLLIPMTWSVLAFRADVLDPQFIQSANDWVWFDWLFTWPPFALWMVVIGLSILMDCNEEKILPRWTAFFNFWCAILIFPAGLIGFFKTGPFAYDGVISFWFAVAVFFGWICVMTVLGFGAVAKMERIHRAVGTVTSEGRALRANI